MLSGFNTNYRHRGVLFHVQTEDSGRSNPHVITHLFYGGNIIASEKRDYSERVDAADLEAEVKEMMEGQHKQMLKQLSRSEHDGAIVQRLGAQIFQDQTDASETLPPAAQPASAPVAAASAARTTSPPPAKSTAPAAPVSAAPISPPHPASPPHPVSADAPTQSTATDSASESPRDRIARAFGDGVVSEKPLDEVVLDYLVENARKRRRSAK